MDKVASIDSPPVLPKMSSSTWISPTTFIVALLAFLVIPTFIWKPGPLLQMLERKKYQYEVTTSLYMLNPTEKFIFNSVVFLLFAILLIAIVLYFPGHITIIATRVYYYMFGGD